MFFRLLFESFRRQRRRKLLAGVAILFGTTAVTAMLALATTIGDRIHRELAVYGANIVVYPQADLLDVKVGGVNLKPATGGAYLHESDLAKLRGIFWANNITGVSPELDGMLKATIYRPDEDDSASGRHSDPEFAEGEESARTTTGSAKATALEGRRPVSYQPGASPQEMNRRGFRGLKSRSISSATDRPGLQPLDLRRFVTWGDAPGWYRSGLRPKVIATGSTRTSVSPHFSGDDAKTVQSSTLEVQVKGLWFDHSLGSVQSPLVTGAPALHPWWKLTGSWPHGSTDVVMGSALAKRLGLSVGSMFMYPVTHVDNAVPLRPLVRQGLVSGIVSTGDATDDEVLMPLEDLQYALNLPDAVSRVEISARTKPEDTFARSDPDKLSSAKREIWYCRPYANSIAYQIQEAIPGSHAEQIRRVEQSEGNVLSRISGLMWLISAAALLAAGFAVSAAMATTILERRAEIGLMRSLGASRGTIALLFYSETGLLAVLSGAIGYLIGSGLAAWLGARIFASDGAPSVLAAAVLNPVLLPIVVGLALLVAIGGSTPAIRNALSMDPSSILRADA